jgi:peroxiredoxin
MKKYFVLLGLIMGSLVQAQQLQTGGFHIKGHIKGIPDNSIVFLADANKPADTLARAAVKGGTFILTGRVTEPNLFVLNFSSAKKKTTLFIGNETVEVTGDIENLTAMQVTGSPSEADFLQFEKVFNPLFAQMNQISQMANAPGNVSKRDSIGEVYQQTAMQIQLKVDSFILQKKSSYVSPFLLVVVNQLSEDVFLLERRYQTLSPEVQRSMYGKYLQEQIDNGKVGAIGSDAQDFSQADTAGIMISLSSFKGKYVLVDFWASWCKPCRMENPNVLAAFERFKAKNFTVLGVSLDQNRSSWIKAINDDKLYWSQVSDLKSWNNDVARQYKIQQIPQNILIDPNGKIIGKNLRGADLDSRLCALLGCN